MCSKRLLKCAERNWLECNAKWSTILWHENIYLQSKLLTQCKYILIATVAGILKWLLFVQSAKEPKLKANSIRPKTYYPRHSTTFRRFNTPSEQRKMGNY
jgi:hypothetical protein